MKRFGVRMPLVLLASTALLAACPDPSQPTFTGEVSQDATTDLSQDGGQEVGPETVGDEGTPDADVPGQPDLPPIDVTDVPSVPDVSDTQDSETAGPEVAETLDDAEVSAEVTPDVEPELPPIDAADGDTADTADTDDTADTADTADSSDTTDGGGPDVPAVNCDNVAAAPIPYQTLTGYSAGEDYALDADGVYYSNENGNLIRKNGAGPLELFVPGVQNTAGMGFLPNGDLIVASVNTGALWKFNKAGGQTTLLSGLQYPNGLDIDYDGTIYVAEQDGQRLRAVNPDTGEFTIVAENICNANGVSFGPNYDRVFVGSFGCGLVYGFDRLSDGTWTEPFIIGENGLSVPGPEPEGPPGWCEGMNEGDLCGTNVLDAGTCQDDGMGALECKPSVGAQPPLLEACAGKGNGEGCVVNAVGQSFPGFCGNFGAQGNNLACNIDDDPTCDGLSAGDDCLKLTYGYVYYGTCSQTFGGLRCNGEPGNGGGGNNPPGIGSGGLDGLNLDVCGNIYVTEYIAGIVWRIDPSFGPPEPAVTLPSQWIPNMHWGTGVNGWDPNTLYVADRDEGRMFALEIGVPGKETTKPSVTP